MNPCTHAALRVPTKYFPRVVILGWVVALAAACTREGTAPTESRPAPQVHAAARSIEQAPLARFVVTIEALGPLRPNSPINLTVRVQAVLPTSRTVLRVATPEIELAARRSWGEDFSLDVGQPVRPARITNPVHMEAGSGFEESISLHVARPGYYRVVAHVTSLDEQPLSFNGLWVRNAEVIEVWLFVTESGGVLTAEFEPERIPSQYDPQPGPFRRQRGRPLTGIDAELEVERHSGPSAGESAEAHPALLDVAGASDYIELGAVYYHIILEMYTPLEGARFDLKGCTKQEWQFICESEDWVDISWGFTDNAGKFYLFNCSSGPTEYEAEVRTHAGSNNFHVLGGLAQRVGPVASDCGMSVDLILQSRPSQVFTNLRKVIAASASLFGTTRPFIEVTIADSTSFYSRSEDRINIGVNHVWHDWGVFITGHEYGHAFHHLALGGNTGGCGGQRHFLDTESSLTCAFSEGFADFYGAVTRPDLGQYLYRAAFEDNYYFPGCASRESSSPFTCTGGPSNEGSLIEGAFAAFLFDLVDAGVEPHDSIAAPGAYVRELVRTCQVVYSGTWRRANGPDEIVYCAENAVNPSGYFARRGDYPSAYSESATEPGDWTAGRVHANWRWNLYEKPD